MTLITVREHARLTTGLARVGSLDEASIPASAFEWLCRDMQRHRAGGAALVQLEDQRWLRLDNYVGVLEAPCGTRIEILPKHVHGETDVATARNVLVRMLRHGLRLPVRDVGPTALQTFDAPVSEWIIQQFLVELDLLVRRGMRFDYHPMEEELRFLRGRLQVARQIRQPAGRQHLFQVEHQVFDANRPANRLIASALDKVAGLTRESANWRLAHELEHQLVEIDRSHDVAGDFRHWKGDRLMSHYCSVRPWCELVLGNRNPTSVVGEWTGRSLLFPMEKVFENFVEACLRRHLPPGAKVKPQAASEYLCRQGSRQLFQLRPDFLITYRGATWVVDAKWKLLDAVDVANHYGLSQSDFYQLFAYGKRYLAGAGQLMLIYPSTERFNAPLGTFDLADGLSLDAIPLDLKSGGLPSGYLPVRCPGRNFLVNPGSLAIVNLTTDEGFMARPAAFVFKTANGIAWVEPGYTDPYGCTMPADHYLTGSVIQMPGDLGLSVECNSDVIATVVPWANERARSDESDSCRSALCDFSDYLVTRDLTLDEERTRVRALLDLDA